MLHAVRFQELGSQCRVTSYALLKLMGKTDTGKNRATLHNRIERLVANAVTVKQGRYTYIGGLISLRGQGRGNAGVGHRADEKLRPLFAGDQFTQIEWAVRHALDGQQLAQWLHGFYATHAKPFPMKAETLLKLSGGENADPHSGKAEAAQGAGRCCRGQRGPRRGFSYEIRGDLVHIEKQAKGAQRRHLAKKASKPRKPRG